MPFQTMIGMKCTIMVLWVATRASMEKAKHQNGNVLSASIALTSGTLRSAELFPGVSVSVISSPSGRKPTLSGERFTRRLKGMQMSRNAQPAIKVPQRRHRRWPTDACRRCRL